MARLGLYAKCDTEKPAVSSLINPEIHVPIPEKGGSDAHMGGPAANRCLEIAAHSHGQHTQTIASSDVCQSLEMVIRGLINRGDGHQTLNGQPIDRPQLRDERVGLVRHDTSLLRLGAGVDLDQQTRAATQSLDSLCEGPGQLFAIERLDDIKQGHCIVGLVGLKRTDKTKFKPGTDRIASRPSALCLLDTVFTKDPLT